MGRLSWATFVCMVAMPAGALALAEGCSSSSNPATPQAEAGAPETSVPETSAAETSMESATAAPDAGSGNVDAGNISLTWGTVLVASGPPQGDGGPDAASDGGGATADAASDGGPSDAGTTADGTSSGATDGSTAADAGADGSVSYTGNYNGGDGGPPAVPGVQICAYPYSAVQALGSWTAPPQSSALSCVTSAADGTFVIPSVPVRTNLVLTLTKTGFIPIVLSIQTASSPMDVRQYPVFMYETATETNPTPSVTVDWQNKGQIIVFAVGVGAEGGAPPSVSMGTQDDASPPSLNGPIYQDKNGNYVASAAGFFPASGGLGLSLAQYFNVAAGTYTLIMTDKADDCEPSLMPLAAWGFPLVTPSHALQVLVLDGYIAGAVGFICTPLSVIVAVDGG